MLRLSPRLSLDPFRIYYSSDREFSLLITIILYYQKDQRGNNVLVLIKPALYYMDITPNKPEYFKIDFYNIIFNPLIVLRVLKSIIYQKYLN